MRKKLTIGILAHVDAGKTTLSEALLYLSGRLRTQGRVDHGNTYLDYDPMERERGITIFSKQARFSTQGCDFILLDTPGHVDLSAEAERVLSLLDYAVLVISAPDGVQNHTRTLWQLLSHYRVPTLLFVNKTDLSHRPQKELEEELRRCLSPCCVGFYEGEPPEQRDERLSILREDWMEALLEGESIEDGEISAQWSERGLFPVLFGAALRLEGVGHLLEVLDHYTLSPLMEETRFGARVYKISHVGSTRLTYIKLTSGCLLPRDELTYTAADGKRVTEKVSQLRLYSGDRFQQTDRAEAGEIVAVLGLSATYAGQGLGLETDTSRPLLEPVLSYAIRLPTGVDARVAFPKLKELEEEEPSLHLTWNRELSQIEARLMGDIQTDLLKRLLLDRFGLDCEIDEGRILYKERISARAIGVGHFEPLRHYAEVQLLMEPLPEGSGLVFDTRLPENFLDLNWQRLILTHLYEKPHKGTLTGALLTDTRILLVAGRAHLKHTEGGDFREATYRAVRQGLMKAGCTLLEPYYSFRLELPSSLVGRAMTDLQNRHAAFEIETSTPQTATLVGRGPVSTLHSYVREVISYTKGLGRMTCVSNGYEPCHNTQEVVAAYGYDPEADIENTPHSVFCSHGVGVTVPWQEVDAHKHLEANISRPVGGGGEDVPSVLPHPAALKKRYALSDEELEAIMLREFGPIKRRRYSEPKRIADVPPKKPKPPKPRRHLVLVDGYNLIFAWDPLSRLAKESLERAREALMDLLASYVAFTKTELVLVFDAYRVKDSRGSDTERDGFRVVYTRANQTADAYIERVIHDLGPDYSIRVVTGDYLLQISALLSGVSRVTTREFISELVRVGEEISALARRLSEERQEM